MVYGVHTVSITWRPAKCHICSFRLSNLPPSTPISVSPRYESEYFSGRIGIQIFLQVATTDAGT